MRVTGKEKESVKQVHPFPQTPDSPKKGKKKEKLEGGYRKEEKQMKEMQRKSKHLIAVGEERGGQV